jgi:hypothetical protein
MNTNKLRAFVLSRLVGLLSRTDNKINLVNLFVYRLPHHGASIYRLIYTLDLVPLAFEKSFNLLCILERFAISQNGGNTDWCAIACLDYAKNLRPILIGENSRLRANINLSSCNPPTLIGAGYVKNIIFVIRHIVIPLLVQSIKIVITAVIIVAIAAAATSQWMVRFGGLVTPILPAFSTFTVPAVIPPFWFSLFIFSDIPPLMHTHIKSVNHCEKTSDTRNETKRTKDLT